MMSNPGFWYGLSLISFGLFLLGLAIVKWRNGKMKIHRITHEVDEQYDRVYWQCDCGIGGSCQEDQWDLHSDKHIKPGEGRIDVYPAR